MGIDETGRLKFQRGWSVPHDARRLRAQCKTMLNGTCTTQASYILMVCVMRATAFLNQVCIQPMSTLLSDTGSDSRILSRAEPFESKPDTIAFGMSVELSFATDAAIV